MKVPDVFRLEGLFVFPHTYTDFTVFDHIQSSSGAHQISDRMDNMVI